MGESTVEHAYGEQVVVSGVSFAIARGAVACILGPSGCGKTTLLRGIAGFEPVRAGEILIDRQVVTRPGYRLPPEHRRIGMVFQDYALFPHLTVRENVRFGLRALQRRDSDARVSELAALVGIGEALDKYPHELSGGQQQRTALAVELRERLSLEVREIIKASGTTAVLVTHDQHEAFAIADEVGILHEGRIQQWDSAYNLYHRPANRFVADFIGQGVLLPAKVLNPHQVEIELGVLDGDIPHQCSIGCDVCGKGCSAEILLRPDDIVHDDASAMQAEVVHKAFRGAEILYTLRLGSGRKVLALVPSHHNHAIGERIGIRLDVDHVIAFAPLAGARDSA